MTRAEELLIKEMRYIASISNGQVKRVAEGAIKSAREYLATEPSGERAELIEELRSRVVGDPFPLMDRAADMLEDDAQQATRVPMTIEEMWEAMGLKNHDVYVSSFILGVRSAEAHHKIHAPK